MSSLYYSHSYVNPETGQLVDVMVDEDPTRNARRHVEAPPSVSAVSRPGAGGFYARPMMPHFPRPPVQVAQPVQTGPAYLSVRKADLLELVPAIGAIWASVLVLPDAPVATGDDVIDRNNATMHREALARHQQSQTRILALTELGRRLINAFTR